MRFLSKSTLVKYKLYDFFELLVGAFSLVSSVLSVWVFWKDETARYQFFAFAVVISFGILVFIKLMKIKSIADKRLKFFAESFHQFAHLVRNEFYGLRRKCKTQKLDSEQLLTNVTNTAQRCVDWIAHAMTISTGENVSVCIKYFPEGQSRNTNHLDVKNLWVKTLVRSYNSSPDRDRESIERVKDSTPLFFLMEGRRSDFRTSDVRQVNNQLRAMGFSYYRDAQPNWEDHYRAVIVVPIRIKAHLQYIDTDASGFDILGFLWADSPSTSAFPKSHIDAYCHLLKSYADVLYPYFDRLDYCLDEIALLGEQK